MNTIPSHLLLPRNAVRPHPRSKPARLLPRSGWTSNRWAAAALAGWLLTLLLAAGPVSAGTLAQFRTAFGSIDVELYDQDKPVTVANFLRYLQAGYFRNVYFHRCIPGFVLQGGEYISLDQSDSSLLTENNIYSWPDFPPIVNEYGAGATLSNQYGTLAMARASGQTNSATSQWFFNLGNNSALDAVDGGFTVFGRVVGGTNILNIFNSMRLNAGIIDMGDWSTHPVLTNLFSTLPVLYVGAAAPRLSDLIYVDITTLNVRILRDTNQANRIRWTSVNGRTNVVEYTDGFPPAWNTLATRVGTGGNLDEVDPTTHAPARFYRVRVLY